MSVRGADVRDHREALARAVPSLALFEYGQVPGLLDPDGERNPGEVPPKYGLVQVERVTNPSRKTTGRTVRTRWRATLRAVGRHFPDNALAALAELQSLENQRLEIAGHTTTPLAVESTEDAEPDDGFYSALIRITYAL